MRVSSTTAALTAAALLALFATACGKDNSSTSPTRTPAAPSTSERYVATIGVGGSGFYSFSVTQYGTVNITLNAVSGFDDPTVAIGVGLGVPTGLGCGATSTITTSSGTAPQITNVEEIGVYCVRVYDAGNLNGPLTFDVSIDHP